MDMHSDQLPVSVETVRALVEVQFPRRRMLPVTELRPGGTASAVVRIGEQLSARFPRRCADVDSTRRSLESGAAAARELFGRPDTAAEHRLSARLTDALERADLDALIGLLVTDVSLSMPPARLEYRGIESARRVLAAVSFRPGRTYRVLPTRANGQPAFGLYLGDPHASVYRAYALLVITTAGDHISAITCFSTDVMPRFGLPRNVPEND